MAAPPLWAPLRGRGNFFLSFFFFYNFLYLPRMATDPGQEMQRFFCHTMSCRVHLPHIDLWSCHLFILPAEGRRSEVPPDSRGVSLVSSFSILLFRANQAWSQIPHTTKTRPSIIPNPSLLSKNSRNFFSQKSWLCLDYQRLSKWLALFRNSTDSEPILSQSSGWLSGWRAGGNKQSEEKRNICCFLGVLSHHSRTRGTTRA